MSYEIFKEYPVKIVLLYLQNALAYYNICFMLTPFLYL